jgi:IS30 family transposase
VIRRKVTALERHTWRNWARAGMTLRDIAAKAERSRGTVQRYVQGYLIRESWRPPIIREETPESPKM